MSNRKIEIFEEQLKAIAENFLNDIQRFSTTAPTPIETVSMPEQSIQNPVIDASTTNVVPIEPSPRFRVFWNAWKDGNISNGESESTLETAQMARAETMTKLYDLGFSNIVILAIETIEPPKEEIASQSI